MSGAFTVTVWSDYVCPWCFIGASELETLHDEFEFSIDWRPFLLRPDAPEEGWPLPDRIKAYIGDPQNPLARRAQGLGLTLNHRLVVPNSRRAHECTEFARHHGKAEQFHRALITSYWSNGSDLHDWSVLEQVAGEVGLDALVMRQEIEAGKWKEATQNGLQAARELGVSSVPTFLIGNRFAIQGAQDAAAFREAFLKMKG